MSRSEATEYLRRISERLDEMDRRVAALEGAA